MQNRKTKYDVYHNGEYVTTINKNLIEKLKITSSNLKLIKSLHEVKYVLHKNILNTDDSDIIKKNVEQLTDIEFQLQKAWGFKENKNYHRFWETPKCTCPKMDNDDSYPSGYYVIDSICPLHGDSNIKDENYEVENSKNKISDLNKSTEEQIKIISYLNSIKKDKNKLTEINEIINKFISDISHEK